MIHVMILWVVSYQAKNKPQTSKQDHQCVDDDTNHGDGQVQVQNQVQDDKCHLSYHPRPYYNLELLKMEILNFCRRLLVKQGLSVSKFSVVCRVSSGV